MTDARDDLIPNLLAALKHPNPNVRAGAAIALGKAGDVRAVEPLIDLLEDPVYLVYVSAEKALGLMGSAAVGGLMAVIQAPPSLDSASRAYEALRSIRDPQATDLLIAATGYDESLIRCGAIEALGNMRADLAFDALMDAARHPDENTRQQAISALGKLGRPDSIHAVTAALNTTDWQMRVTAVRALGRIGTEDAILPLLVAMRDPVVQVREAAAQMIQSLRFPEATEILLMALNGADAWTRCHVARAMGEFKDQRAIPVLENLAINDDDVQVRLAAAQSLAKMQVSRGEAIILRTLNAPSAQTRVLAAIALGNIGKAKAVQPLLENDLLQTQNGAAGTRQFSNEIVTALNHIGVSAVPTLIATLESPERRKQEMAFKALSEIKMLAGPSLLEKLQTSTLPHVRQQVIRLLGITADQRAVEPLAEILRRGVAATFSPRAVLNAVFDSTAEERKLAADALGQIAVPACIAPLLASARFDLDRDVREQAGRALASFGDAESILQLAEPEVFGEISRSWVSILVVLIVGFAMGGFAHVVSEFRFGVVAGLGVGAIVGLVDGWTGRKRAIQGTLVGAGMVVGWGMFAGIFADSPTVFELMQVPLIRVAALFFAGLGALAGTMVVNPLSRQYRVRYVPRGCILVILPGMFALAGLVVGNVAGAVLVLRAGDPAFFRWMGGVFLAVLVFVTWMQRGQRMELQKGLLGALGLLGMTVLCIALAIGVPASMAVWIASTFPILGASLGWGPLPLFRRLAGLFGGMIAGFVGAGLGVWVLGMVK